MNVLIRVLKLRQLKDLATYFNTFCTRRPATTPIVVGRLAAQTPSRFRVFSSMFAATTSGGAHWQKEKDAEKDAYNCVCTVWK